MSQRVRVVCVKGINKSEERAKICYVGRRYAGWPDTEWGNHKYLPCPDKFLTHLLTAVNGIYLRGLLDRLWEACEHGAKPLGCWCGSWQPGDPPLACHAYVWAELLNQKYIPFDQYPPGATYSMTVDKLKAAEIDRLTRAMNHDARKAEPDVDVRTADGMAQRSELEQGEPRMGEHRGDETTG